MSGTICVDCGGTILPPAAAGVDRGSCHCPKGPGSIHCEMLYSTASAPAHRTYGVEWEGAIITIDPPTLSHASEVLAQLRAEYKAANQTGEPKQ